MIPRKKIISILILVTGIIGASCCQAQAQSSASSVPAASSSGTSGASVTSAAASAGANAQTGAANTSAPRNVAATLAVVDPGALVVAPDHTQRVPKVGEKLYEGVHLDMADGGYIAVRPNTSMKISRYQANGDADDRSVIGLLKGSLRSITGWIGHDSPKNYAIVTPTATIGVRGTDHEPAYVPEGTPGQDAGTYDNVHAGGTTIATASGKVDVTPEHAGFADLRPNSRPRVLDRVPTFFQVPHAHDNLLIGKHEKVMASIAQQRSQRVEQHREELRNQPAARAGLANRPAGGLAQRANQRPTGLAERSGERPGERLNNSTARPFAGRQDAGQARPTPLLDAMRRARENAASNAANRAAPQSRAGLQPAERTMPARAAPAVPAPAPAKPQPKRPENNGR
jgi:hypothetical protein